MGLMSAEKATERSGEPSGTRFLSRPMFALVILLGLTFMHGACAALHMESSVRAANTSATASQIIGPAEDSDHHSDQVPCCDEVLEASCVALLVASFLLVLALSPLGLAAGFGVARTPRRVCTAPFRGPPRGLPRLALCVVRI